jgi:membrane protease YdiL (CAAX protease family)
MHRGRLARMPAGISNETTEALQPLCALAPAPSRVSVSSMARRHPLMFFFVLAFAFSWVVWAPAVILARGPSEPRTLAALFHLAGGLGPMVSAFVITALAGGSAGVRELLGRVLRWQVGLGWWLVAVAGPAILFLVAAVISRLLFGGWPELGEFGHSEEFAFLGLIPYWVANIIFYGFGEEVGWRGFALPRLQTGRSALLAARSTSRGVVASRRRPTSLHSVRRASSSVPNFRELR